MSAHGMMPVYVNNGYHRSSSTTLTEINILSASSVTYGHCIKLVVENGTKELEESGKRMKKYVD
jgi:hypothetical protein